ncbi:MAG: phosphoserine phosphatase [Ruminococcaceae bacterium]|nr:phosphoserine phosphatase [Oscillospiraceae bacterium]
MNVYDFDETIYNGDSTRDFYFYTLKNKKSILKYIPKQGFYFVLFALGIITKTKFKEKFYSFFKSIKNIDDFLEEFWNEHEKNIKEWYIKNQKEDDIIISASPYFLLLPICKRLKINHLLASNVDKFTGKYDGENCWGEEKVKRLDKYTSDYSIDEFYSDSYSDSPLANLAKKAYIVKGNELYDWNEYKK